MAYKYSVTSLVLTDEYDFEIYVYSDCEEAKLPENTVFEEVYGREKAFMYLKEPDDNKAQDIFLEYYKQHFIFNYSYVNVYSINLEGIYGVFNIPEGRLGEIPLTSMIPIKSDDSVKNYFTNTRRPYYQLRGKSVTEEQALDIIRRTDVFGLQGISEDRVPPTNFNMWWLMENHIPAHYGWVQPDGTVGLNGITQKYPNIGEYVCEWAEYMEAFPYLDLVAVVTSCNEIVPDECSFEEFIDIGIWAHDGMVEFLEPKAALKKYNEYCNLYEDANKARYEPETCLANQNKPIDIAEYKERCIQACQAANPN